MSKRTWQPKKKKKLRTCGFLARMSSFSGQKTIKNRRSKERSRLAL